MGDEGFTEELALFEEHRAEWLDEHHNQFVVIKGCEVIGLFPTLGEAYRAGLARFGNVEMLIKEVLHKDPSYFARTVIG